MRHLAMVTIPFFAAILLAQYESRTITTTKTSWQGMLVDADCQNTHVEHRESSWQTNPDRSVTTRTETTHTHAVECPATQTTTAFGLLTSDGRYIQFDDPSNLRVVETVNSSPALSRSLAQRVPLRVSVNGTANGGVAVVESLVQVRSPAATAGESARIISSESADVMFDVRYDGDHGKLVVTPNGLHFEDISDADHSRSWSYSEIKELEREDDREIKIKPYSGDSLELRIEGAGMSETVYQMIADRIVAARTR